VHHHCAAAQYITIASTIKTPATTMIAGLLSIITPLPLALAD